MKLKTLEKGEFIYQQGDYSKEMYLIQSGKIEVFTYLNDNSFEFTIENLQRGCLINQNSFLFNDELDTDCRCVTEVSMYVMKIETLKNLRKKHVKLDEAIEVQERYLLEGEELAIDYTIEDQISNTHFKKHKKNGDLMWDHKKEQHR